MTKIDEVYDLLSAVAETDTDMPLSAMTTLRIGGEAKYVVYPKGVVALDTILRILNTHHVPFKIIGKGSDLLCSDAYYNGAVIRLDRHFDHCCFVKDRLIAQAGCSIIYLSVEAMKNGYSGLEFASGIPGTLGGAVFMNAGAYKSSMSAVIEEVFVYRNQKLEWIKLEECGFAYRHSAFQSHPDWIVIAARMKLTPKDKNEIETLMKDRRERRLKSQPLDMPSCGSVFRNPEGKNAWELIEGIGYRGKKNGGAEVSSKHCNFIVNADHSTASDYLNLVEDIQKKVKEKYDIDLETEMEKFNWQ